MCFMKASDQEKIQIGLNRKSTQWIQLCCWKTHRKTVIYIILWQKLSFSSWFDSVSSWKDHSCSVMGRTSTLTQCLSVFSLKTSCFYQKECQAMQKITFHFCSTEYNNVKCRLPSFVFSCPDDFSYNSWMTFFENRLLA